MKKGLLLLVLILVLVQPVSAHEVSDLTVQGSIHITMRYDGSFVSGGEMTLYRVGDIAEENGNYCFLPTQQFQPADISFENVQSPETAQKLAQYAREQKLQGETKAIRAEGTVSFERLQPGLYMIMQRKAAEGYYAAEPFLVSLPMQLDGKYTYQVEASPKITPIPLTPPENPEQPKTGQSGWPIWTFLLSGAALTVLLYRKKTI